MPMAFGLNSSVESGAGKTQFTDRISKVSEFIATIVVRYSTKELNDEVGKKEEGTSDVVSMVGDSLNHFHLYWLFSKFCECFDCSLRVSLQ